MQARTDPLGHREYLSGLFSDSLYWVLLHQCHAEVPRTRNEQKQKKSHNKFSKYVPYLSFPGKKK